MFVSSYASSYACPALVLESNLHFVKSTVAHYCVGDDVLDPEHRNIHTIIKCTQLFIEDTPVPLL